MPDKSGKRSMLRATLWRAIRGTNLLLVGAGIGFGLMMAQGNGGGHYNPHLFAVGVSGLLALTCTLAAFLVFRSGVWRKRARAFEAEAKRLAAENQALQDAEKRTQRFIEAQADPIVRRDASGAILYANESYRRLTASGGNPLVLEQGDTAVLSDARRVHDQRIATPEGERWIAWQDISLPATAGIETYSVGRDVTDRVLAERALAEARDQAEEANGAKSRFLATVSHEIRTPLNGILGMSDLLLDTPLSPEQVTYARAVKTSGETLLSLIEELLDFSKIEAGRIDLDAQPFALSGLIEDIVELLAVRAQDKGLEIAALVDERLPLRVTGDVVRLRQVLLNLAGNAIKFTQTGGVAVVVEPGIWPQEIRFRVRDTGPGIPADQQARIFEEFEQGMAGEEAAGGTGLGLAIARRIVERMGGTIRVESAPGAGALFEFSIALPAADPAGLSVAAAPDLAGKHILIVSGVMIEAPLLARRITRWGARVTIVPDAAAAAAIFPERNWHAILAADTLGDAELGELARISAKSPARRIVMVTPAARDKLPGLKSRGYASYLVKPVRMASLAAQLAASVDGSASAPHSFEDTPPAAAVKPAHGLSILIAEDNEINALLARALLVKLGHRPALATRGDAALDTYFGALAAGTPFELVLMDVRMPGIDGLEATRRIRRKEAETGRQPVPIIALTANAFPEHREACLAAGMTGFIAKPLDRERLMRALDEVFPPKAAAA